MIPPAVGLFFKNLPWSKILLAIAVGLVVWAVVSYIRNAEENRTKVGTLETSVSELKQANADLESEYQKQISVLETSIEKEREREKSYGENIEIIRSGPNGSCAAGSPAISKSLRLRRERAASDPARKGARSGDNARASTSAQRSGSR